MSVLFFVEGFRVVGVQVSEFFFGWGEGRGWKGTSRHGFLLFSVARGRGGGGGRAEEMWRVKSSCKCVGALHKANSAMMNEVRDMPLF